MLLTACGQERVRPSFHPEANPPTLSAWGALQVEKGRLILGEGVEPYTLNTPLFTDYASKLRTVWMLSGSASIGEEGSLDFPVGTVITKTFYYPEGEDGTVTAAAYQSVDLSSEVDLSTHRLIETRLLVRREDGWHPVSYVWNEEQTEATLKRTGAVVPLTLADHQQAGPFAYVVPNENQCAGCHAPDAASGRIEPLGPTAGQLSRREVVGDEEGEQLLRLAEAGFVTLGDEPAVVQTRWDDASASLDQRARSYLAANCAHCHNPQGPADTSGLDLSLGATGAAVGRCKPPIAAGSGTGGHRFGIEPGRPEASILTYRVGSTDPGAMMPELGRSLVHEEGLALLNQWIAEMDGTCSET
ncbi:hypothetical protein NOG11_03750 [Parvularcula sp. BGMRC 0090]|uniref:Cytochrome c domain-containing protein n=2 Tax=Parvularcula maris TaxID=2965077 RepID=A0A9X2L7H2_9PROT|nr:hypothetical protein [Parvularcula maris]